MIKNIKPSRRSKFKQGYYKVKNKDKYVGDIFKIIYRSSYEMRFCIWCDLNPNVVRWSSEPFSINYISEVDNKKHRYYIDFYIEVKSGDSIKKYLIEVKPNNKLNPPNKPKKKTKKQMKIYESLVKEYYTNKSKFESAKKFSKTIGAEFKIVTESFLQNIK